MVKTSDRSAWLAALFAPPDKRHFLYAIEAFAIEIAGVRAKVREPLAGELRLQWWTDAIEGEARGDVRGHPVAAALIETIRRAHLPRATLTGMIDARRTDLYDDPLASLDEYAARADQIHGARISLEALALQGTRDPTTEAAARHAGRAMAVVETLRAFTSGGTPLHMTVPLDLLRQHGIGAAEVLVRRTSAPIRAAIAALVDFAWQEWAALRDTRRTLDPRAAPAFLTANLAVPELKRTRQRAYDPFTTQVGLAPWRQQWILWRAARRNGIL
ncbi:phytoene/squalene synthase family protein [Lichenifustis flavocetrariae]|uniref:Squalene/phytoene synthase family protein n=1 Tax=Lichenifustis flavocetrariae TaxID=2949735 RepID=A0AA41YXE5_9HYPH|nr:squalene/phytoene synthase family protein [Lichenifustis flavocetrariae]MCW6506698.1 squalene/phytoene synthase family protein [Lichenifustis flavocetrariae]